MQLTNVANAIQKPPAAPKPKVIDIPASQQTNPMVLVNTKPLRSHLKAPSMATLFEPSGQAGELGKSPSHLVPPGTEPPLPSPGTAVVCIFESSDVFFSSLQYQLLGQAL